MFSGLTNKMSKLAEEQSPLCRCVQQQLHSLLLATILIQAVSLLPRQQIFQAVFPLNCNQYKKVRTANINSILLNVNKVNANSLNKITPEQY
jgi:hypothetical protein